MPLIWLLDADIGSSEDRARATLEACNWNIELAVNMHVDGIDTGEPVDVTM